MSEAVHDRAPKPQDPDFTPAQLAVKGLTDEILALRTLHMVNTCHVVTRANPAEVQERLRASSFGDLLLKDGDSLSAQQPNDYFPELGLFVGQAELKAVRLRAWGQEYDKRRIDPNGPTQPPYHTIDYPGEEDWSRQLDIRLLYSNGREAAFQEITTYTSSSQAGQTPSLSRSVTAIAYVETGYEGHNRVKQDVVVEEHTLAFTAIARELFDARITP